MSEGHPLEGQIVLLAGAKASVTLTTLSRLVRRVHKFVADRRAEYDRRFERLDGPDGRAFSLAEPDHWETVGDALDLTEREVDAIRRVHSEQFRRAGRKLGREDEFEATLEIRDPVVTGRRESRSSR